VAASLAFGFAVSACATAHPTSQALPASTPAEQARADSGVQHYTAADVAFMQGMIHHHGQAIVMAAMAPSHGASSDVKILASRIDVGQRDEIAFMQRWLRERHEMAADPLSMPGMAMPGMAMPDTLMPGMLTPQQMAQLSAASGAEFDRLFLTFMIQHHTGALTMVNHLFATTGAAREEYVFRFASDVSTDQTTEIDRMRSMLATHFPQRDHQ
jgi:uncharacterized protein (DUF305 family)